MVALPMDGELYVEFRNVCMPQVAEDAEESLSVVDEASFEHAWSSHQTPSTTDEWRVGYIRAICFRSWLSADQVVSVLDHFIQPKVRFAQQNIKALASPWQLPSAYFCANVLHITIIDCKYAPLQDKLEAAFCMFWRLASYKEFYKIHCFLSHNLRSELYHRIGLTDHLDLRMPMGHYRLDMRMRVQNCAAHLLQVLHLLPGFA